MVSLEGIIIFLILVVFRKSVSKEIFREWLPNSKLIPKEWREFVNDDDIEDGMNSQIDYTQNVTIENNQFNEAKSNDIIVLDSEII